MQIQPQDNNNQQPNQTPINNQNSSISQQQSQQSKIKQQLPVNHHKNNTNNNNGNSVIANVNICSNKICSLYKPTKINLSNENLVQNLCLECLKQYKKQAYCIYCKQIYFQFTDDGKEWIMCDQCQRWVHTECSDYYNHQPNSIFYCVKCKKIDQITNNVVRRTNGRGISGKVPERRKTQECFLNNYGFYWQLSPGQLAEDFQKLKQLLK